jgi:deoxyuridine 5''-triphosphate nucleotidohydrolase (dut)
MIRIKFKKLHENAIAPHKTYSTDAGFDLFAVEDYKIKRGNTIIIKTGLAVEIPTGYEMQIRPRSGLAFLCGLTVVNSPGTIDSGYRGEIGIIVTLIGNFDCLVFQKGHKIAQAVICKLPDVEFVEVDILGESERSDNGFGSSSIF